MAEKIDTPKVQLYAERVVRHSDRIVAEGDVVVYYGDMILQADRVSYDTNRSVMTLDGDVTAMRGMDYAMLSDHVRLDLKRKYDIFDDYFLSGFESQLWVRGKEARKKEDKMSLQEAFLSSCSVTCPDWHIEFSSAEYNETTQWVDIYNPRFYIHDTPVFWLPYIGTSMVRKRKSGLLRPNFGISDRDGFTYEQPIYLAIDPQWDLEVTPQFRTGRGVGAYATFRFVDTPHSHGDIKAGYFRSKNSYVQAYDLKNSSHYGVELHYENRGMLAGLVDDANDGLYIDATYLNDPDYINLQATTSTELADSSQVQSRVNYFFNTPNNYIGLYGRYFIDTSLSDEQRRNTFQNIPTIQLHHYQTALFGFDFLQYAADYRYNHYFTESGKHIQFQELNLPLALYGNFFDDYLKFSISENLYYSYSSFDHMDEDLVAQNVKNHYYSLFRNYHTIDLYTDLAKDYGNTFHTMQLRVTYNKPSFSSEKGDTVDTIQVLRSPRENLLMSAINYLYDAKGKEFLYYRIVQPVLYEPIEEIDDKFNRYGDLEQEIRYRFLEHYELYTDLFWSYYLHNLSGATSYLKLNYPKFDIMINHFFKQRLKRDEQGQLTNRVVKTSDFFTLSGRYRSESGHDYYAGVSYDSLHDKVNRWNVGAHFFRRCWDLDVGLRDEIVPILTSADKPDNIHNVTIYFTINLVPFGAYTHTIHQGL